MQFEKIKIINKNKIIIGGLIGLGVISAICVLPSFAKYKLTESINIANGIVNYKVPDFKVMAIYQQNDTGTYEEVTMMPESGYVINEEETYCTVDNVNQIKGKIKTVNGIHGFTGLTKGDKCYLYFDKEKSPSEKTLAIFGITANTATPDFSQIAITDEGVFKIEDGMYGNYSYYWRGTAPTNHVIFANKCWRIVRINGDGTMRLIYNGAPSGTVPNQTCPDNGKNSTTVVMGVTVNEKYYATSDGQSNNSSYVGWTYTLSSQRSDDNATVTASNAKVQTEKWYKTNITDKGYDDKVVEGLFCNDRNIGQPYSSWSGYATTWSTLQGSRFAYAGVDRLWNKFKPTLDCSKKTGENDIYKLKVGAITADEVELAGGKNKDNTFYYLYNGQSYWTMSPERWYNGYAWVFYVASNGNLSDGYVQSYSYGLRPVINLRSDITFSSGDGTLNNPYIVN